MAKPDREPLHLGEALILAALPAGSGLAVRALDGDILLALLAVTLGMLVGLTVVVVWRHLTHRPRAW